MVDKFARVSQRTFNKSREPQYPLLPKARLLQLPLLSTKEAIVARNQSTFSRPQPRLVQVDVVVLEPEPGVELRVCLPALELELLELRDWETLTSSAITLNSNNFAKSFSNNHKCSSLSFNKSVQATHNWLL